jgi:phosphoglycerate dehydrogenase-like enzyme
MKNILIALPLKEEDRQKFIEIKPDFRYVFLKPKEISREIITEMNVIIGNVDLELIKYAKQLEWLQLNTAGYENYLEEGILNTNTLLTNATGAYGPAVSEHLLALLFSVSKKLHLYRDSQKINSWDDHGEVLPLHGQRVLIIGLGDIGHQIGKVLHAMGNTIIGIRRKLDNKPLYIDQLVSLKSLNEELKKADIIICTIPLNKQTKGLIGWDEFEIMKDTAIFFNVGRGGVVVTEALVNALINNKIIAAGVDTIDPEPLPTDSPLWQLPNLFITPHISGYFHLPETLDRIIEISLQNYKNFINQEKLSNLIEH